MFTFCMVARRRLSASSTRYCWRRGAGINRNVPFWILKCIQAIFIELCASSYSFQFNVCQKYDLINKKDND